MNILCWEKLIFHAVLDYLFCDVFRAENNSPVLTGFHLGQVRYKDVRLQNTLSMK